METKDLLECCVDLLDKTYLATRYTDTEDAEVTFKAIKKHLTMVAQYDDSSIKTWKKFSNLGKSVFSCSSLNDLVKIIWRMAKEKGGQPHHMLCTFIIGLGAIIFTVRGSQPKEKTEHWEDACLKWLGNQLTIGGKGVTGEGEGTVLERIKCFFMTPYLHDFD